MTHPRGKGEPSRSPVGGPPWNKWPGRKPAAGESVLVFRRDNRCMHLAWHDGKRWWAWNDDDGQNDVRLAFKPSHWRELPENPRPR